MRIHHWALAGNIVFHLGGAIGGLRAPPAQALA